MTAILDPREGDIEDDASSMERRSLLWPADSLLAEISLPKLVATWMLLIGLPGLLLRAAPLLVSFWIRAIVNNLANAFYEFAPVLLLALLAALGWFAGRPLLRLIESSFWSLHALAVQPVYVVFREGLRHLAESRRTAERGRAGASPRRNRGCRERADLCDRGGRDRPGVARDALGRPARGFRAGAGRRPDLAGGAPVRPPHGGRATGDVPTIDAAQGLTSAEHIQAMLPGTQAVTGYKAYTAASRHRVTSYLVTSDGAERREIASGRPLGNPRPIREADGRANMARNLSRQLEMPAALDLLQQTHRLHRGVTHALQRALQPAEQRVAELLPQAMLHHAWQRPRVVARVAELAAELGRPARDQAAALDALGQFVPVAREAAVRTIGAMTPALRRSIALRRETARQSRGQQIGQGYEGKPSRGPIPY